MARAYVGHPLGVQASEERVEQVLSEAEPCEHQRLAALVGASARAGRRRVERLRAVFRMQLSIHSMQPSVYMYFSACKQ